MSLKHILLGLLSEPAAGYDLKKEFERSLHHFWSAELSQIYPVLGTLERDGLLSSSTGNSTKGPPRKLYKRTEQGTQELVQWLAEGPHVSDERRHYLAQVFFLDAFADPGRALEFLQQLRATFSEKCDALERADAIWRESDPRYPDALPDAAFYRMLSLQLGRRVYASTVAWCDESIARMRAREDDAD